MRTCTIDGCERKHHAKGYCGKHYQRFQRWGSPTYRVKSANDTQVGECKIDGCDNPKRGRGYCESHLARIRRNGHPADQWGRLLLGEPKNPNLRKERG